MTRLSASMRSLGAPRVVTTPHQDVASKPGAISATAGTSGSAGVDGWTTSTFAVVPSSDTGAKSFTGSYGRFLYSAGFIAWLPMFAISSVYASGTLRAVVSHASTP